MRRCRIGKGRWRSSPTIPKPTAISPKRCPNKARPGLALACWQRTVALDPADVGALGDFAAALQKANRFDEAAAHYERALALKPDHVEMHCGFAAALHNAGRPSEAIDRYQQALALAPDHVGAQVGIAGVLEGQGRTGDATLHYERALALRPDLAHLRFRLCTAQLPILYLDEAEIEGRRAAYRRRLEQLCADVEAGRAGGDLAAAVGSNQPFYLPYQGQNDRDLQQKYGALVCRAIAGKYPAAPMPPPPAPGEKVRVGIVSGLFRHHTVWKLMIRGWLSQLDRSRFEVFGYHTGGDRDFPDRDRRQTMRPVRSGAVAGRPLARGNPRRPAAHPALPRHRHGPHARPGSPRTGWRRPSASPGATRTPPATRRSTISCRAT